MRRGTHLQAAAAVPAVGQLEAQNVSANPNRNHPCAGGRLQLRVRADELQGRLHLHRERQRKLRRVRQRVTARVD